MSNAPPAALRTLPNNCPPFRAALVQALPLLVAFQAPLAQEAAVVPLVSVEHDLRLQVWSHGFGRLFTFIHSKGPQRGIKRRNTCFM